MISGTSRAISALLFLAAGSALAQSPAGGRLATRDAKSKVPPPTLAPSGAGGHTSFVAGDGCAAPIPVVGLGTFAFNNMLATTGPDGQANGACDFPGGMAIDDDLWFSWTSPASGIATLSTCGLTGIDTKIAVYRGGGCPVLPAVACNDDACGLQSEACFEVHAGSAYTFQIGVFPGAAPGAGSFSIAITSEAPTCRHDDGSAENSLGLVAGGTLAWLQRFGAVGVADSVDTVSTAWGCAAFPGLTPPNGTPAWIGIWDDPNDDGDPTDAVLLRVVPTAVQNVDSDIVNPTAIVPPVPVNGIYFVGAALAHAVGQFPAPFDMSGCGSAGRAWAAGSAIGVPFNFVNLAANGVPPLEMDSIALPGLFLLRANCSSASDMYCFGDGTGAACPCGNSGLLSRGCQNSAGTGGARLQSEGDASLASDTLEMTCTGEMPTATSILLQGTTQINPVVFGDGLRCVGGTLKRLYLHNASGGTVVAPIGADLPISVRSATLGSPIFAGDTRYYQFYYRDQNPNFCSSPPGSTFNVSSAVAIQWGP